MKKENLIQRSEFLWEIPLDPKKGMRVPAHIIASEEILEDMLQDRTLQQLINVTTLPGIQKSALVMPDAHEGYGFPIGGVAATSFPGGLISPGGIGYDINCGVRLLLTPDLYRDREHNLDKLSEALYDEIPSGPGKGGKLVLTDQDLREVLEKGAQWAVEKGYGYPEDLERTEAKGRLDIADPQCVSDKAKERGRDQLGTIGSGNHFVEVDRVEKIFDPDTARAFGLRSDQLVVLIHTGSRGLGHQIATDYIRRMMEVMETYDIRLPDRELSGVPWDSPEGQEYYRAMCCAANFAWCNRQVITWEVRKAWEKIFGSSSERIHVLYDVAHNIAKIEDHNINGSIQKVIVHRKGATRAFGPGHEELPADFMKVGQPVLIPGSMGTASYVLSGTSKSMEISFGSTCHGAGRRLSRRAAKKQVDAPGLTRRMEEEGIHIRAGSYRGVAEEAPIAYKDVDKVVETVHLAEIAQKVVKLRPVAVIKG